MRVSPLTVLLVLCAVHAESTSDDDGVPLPLNAVPRGQLWHHNAQIAWRDARLFRPEESLTFQYIKAGGVDLHFLDHTHLSGFDGQDLVSIGPYTVETRLGMITRCNKPLCHRVDGIVGFGYLDHDRSPCLFKTLTQDARSDWGIEQPFEFRPMPRIFSLTAAGHQAELQLGGFDPDAIEGDISWIPMSKYQDYGASVVSVTYGDGEDAVELLQFKGQEENMKAGRYKTGYIGKFDSGTTCILMPNTTIGGQLAASPFQTLLDLQLKGVKRSLFYTFIDEHHRPVKMEIEYEHCVEPTSYRMILGDPFFKKFVVVHDMQDPAAKRMGLGIRKESYDLARDGDNDFLGAFAYDSAIPDPGNPVGASRAAAMAGLKEAAEEERHLMPEPHAPTPRRAERAGQNAGARKSSRSPYKIGASRMVATEADGSLAGLGLLTSAAAALRQVPGPILESVGSQHDPDKTPSAFEDIDDLQVPTSSGARGEDEPWEDVVEGLEKEEARKQMSEAVNKVRLNSDHIVYTIDLGVGTPPQRRRVVFDTGSYVLGIFSREPPEDAEPLLADDTPVSAAESDLKRRYHILDLQRSTRELDSWMWSAAGQEGFAVAALFCSGCATVWAFLLVRGRRCRRWLSGSDAQPERMPLFPA